MIKKGRGKFLPVLN